MRASMKNVEKIVIRVFSDVFGLGNMKLGTT